MLIYSVQFLFIELRRVPKMAFGFPVVWIWASLAGTLLMLSHFLIISSPRLTHYLGHSFRVPGIFRGPKTTVYATINDVLAVSAVSPYMVKEETACDGCGLLTPFSDREAHVQRSKKVLACRKTKDLSFSNICLTPYGADETAYVWGVTGYYGQHYRKAFEEIFENFPETSFLDINCGFGAHSLLAASLGFQVVSIDSDTSNLLALQKSARIAQVSSRILLLWNEVREFSKGNENWKKTNKEPKPNDVTLNDLAHYIMFHPTDEERGSFWKNIPFGRLQWIVRLGPGVVESVFLSAELMFGAKCIIQAPILMVEFEFSAPRNDRRSRDMISLFYKWGYCAYGFASAASGYIPVHDLHYSHWPNDIILLKQFERCNSRSLLKLKSTVLGSSS